MTLPPDDRPAREYRLVYTGFRAAQQRAEQAIREAVRQMQAEPGKFPPDYRQGSLAMAAWLTAALFIDVKKGEEVWLWGDPNRSGR